MKFFVQDTRREPKAAAGVGRDFKIVRGALHAFASEEARGKCVGGLLWLFLAMQLVPGVMLVTASPLATPGKLQDVEDVEDPTA